VIDLARETASGVPLGTGVKAVDSAAFVKSPGRADAFGGHVPYSMDDGPR
jgi:hypothetical protein